MSRCAITDVIFDSNGNVNVLKDLKIGNPIIDIVPSQGEGLCIYYQDNVNSQEGKIDLQIMNDDYKATCPTIEFNEHKFTLQKLHKKIPGIKVNEKDLFD